MEYLYYSLAALGGLLVLLIAVVLIRTVLFRPKNEQTKEPQPLDFDRNRAVENLQMAVKCRTVSYYSHAEEDEEEFDRLMKMLPERFPNVYRECTLTEFPDRGLLYKWKGKSDHEPTVLMAHFDVVPVLEEAWEKPPFEGVIENGILWGRGTLDTKITFCSALFAVDHLISKGFQPQSDVYLAFSGCEEVNGLGAVHIVDWFEKEGITPGLVLDEGGAVVEKVFPGVTQRCAFIGIAEKGMIDLQYSVKSRGGHASAPKPRTPIGVLSHACVRIGAHPFKMHITPPVQAMFNTLGCRSTFLYRMIFANLWLFKPLLNLICKKSGGELNALVRTTVAFTQMKGSSTTNVIPPEASMVSNMRLNPCDTVESAIEYIRKSINDSDVELKAIRGTNPSRISRIDTDGYRRVDNAITDTWLGVVTSPYLMVQCSDSRHWGRISDRVYRFSAMDLTNEERGTIHGHNEHIRLETVEKAAEFYLRLLMNC